MAISIKHVDERVTNHEEICSIRYDAIHRRLEKVELALIRATWAAMAVLASSLGAILLTFIK